MALQVFIDHNFYQSLPGNPQFSAMVYVDAGRVMAGATSAFDNV